MSYRIVISSFAAVAIGVSCIATDASARGGGGGSGGGGRSGGTAPGVHRTPEFATGVLGPTGGGAAGASGGGVAAGALYYAPASYYSNAACGRYPYPPCNKVPTR